MKIPFLNFDFNAPSEEGVDPVSSARSAIYMELLPFLGGYVVFVFTWMILLWDIWDSLAPTSTVWGLGYILFFRWRDQIRAEAQSLPAINLMIRYSHGKAIPESNVVVEFKVLKEPTATELKKAEETVKEALKEKPETAESPAGEEAIRVLAVSNALASLVYITEAVLIRPFKNPETEELFSEIIFIHHGPVDRTFEKVPNQWIYHRGQMIPGSASLIDCDYLGYKTELDHKPVLHVKADPYSTRLNQEDSGLTPRLVDGKLVEGALTLSSAREALKLRLELRESRAENRDLKIGYRDGTERGVRLLGRALKDVEIITRPGEPLRDRFGAHWKTIAKVLVGLGVLYFLVWGLDLV